MRPGRLEERLLLVGVMVWLEVARAGRERMARRVCSGIPDAGSHKGGVCNDDGEMRVRCKTKSSIYLVRDRTL